MKLYITTNKVAQTELKDVIKDYFNVSEDIAIDSQSEITKHLHELRDDIYIVIETDYVDKVYRDSFYSYYSSKLNEYQRNCIRLSFFNQEITKNDFRDEERLNELQKNYLGFLIIRPTEPSVLGRSAISPAALKSNHRLICSAEIAATANSLKFRVNAFPHSSQDTETIKCAETTLWALMEYFGVKYPEYKPVLPSKIIQVLRDLSNERQLPSQGLQIHQISYALKEFGFGTKIYSRAKFGSQFDNIVSCYIESGIPLVVALQNNTSKVSGISYIGHSVLMIGHEIMDTNVFDSMDTPDYLPKDILSLISSKGYSVYDFDDVKKRFVFIDDNWPIYQLASLQEPTSHYPTASWKACEISHIVVPLYPKIYLEAYRAKDFILRFLVKGHYCMPNGSEILLRTYLASSRSYKQYIAHNPNLADEVKDMILEQNMSKFIWVSEISDKQLIKRNEAKGLVILDATEPNMYNFEPLILALHTGYLINYSESDKSLTKIPVSLQPFSIFDKNLNHIT